MKRALSEGIDDWIEVGLVEWVLLHSSRLKVLWKKPRASSWRFWGTMIAEKFLIEKMRIPWYDLCRSNSISTYSYIPVPYTVRVYIHSYSSTCTPVVLHSTDIVSQVGGSYDVKLIYEYTTNSQNVKITKCLKDTSYLKDRPLLVYE